MIAEHMNFLGLYAGAVDRGTCATLISTFEDCASLGLVHAGRTHGGINTSIKNSQDIDIRAFPHLGELQHAVVEAIDACYQLYQSEYPQVANAMSPHKITSLQIQKYAANAASGYFPFHCESGGPDTANRVSAYVLYLNDVHSGGETEFLTQKIRVPPRQGNLCIFPAGYTHAHRGNPVLDDGPKYILTGWYTFI